MMTEEYFFVSYAHANKDFSAKLVAGLRNAGFRIWMDESEIRPAYDWRKSIEKGINDCTAMIAVISPHYVRREYCLKELARANELRLPVIPILLEKVDSKDYPLAIQGVQYIDFSDWHNETTYRNQFDKLFTALKQPFPALITARPPATIQYLNELIADLEKWEGVLEYTLVSGQMEELAAEATLPHPRKRLEPGLSLLVDEKKEPLLANIQSSLSDTARMIKLKDVREAVKKQPRFVLIGVPGAGKTTIIRRLVRDMARSHISNPMSEPFPIFIQLAGWNQNETLLNYIREHCNRKGLTAFDPIELLSSGDAFLFLDGLNEMGAKGTEKSREIRAWLKANNAPSHVVVTCRASDYTPDFDLALPVVLVNELDNVQIQEFAHNYLPKTAHIFLRRVLPWDSALQADSHSLARMARNPFLLHALIILFRKSPEKQLPSNNGMLMSDLIKALWGREEVRSTKHKGWLERSRMELAFSRLAFAMHYEGTSLAVPKTFALQYLNSIWRLPINRQRKSLALLEVGQNANLIEIDGDGIRFRHQLVQEYFTAIGAAHYGVTRIVPTAHVGRWGWYVRDKWEPVIIILSGLQDSEKTIQTLIHRNAYLASVCISTGVTVPDAVLRQLIECLLHALHDKEDAGVRSAGAKALGLLKHPSVVPELLRVVDDWNTDVVQAAIAALGEIGSGDAFPTLVSLLYHPDLQKSKTAAAVLLCDPGYAKIPAIVKDWIENPRRTFDISEVKQIASGLHHHEKSIKYATLTTLGALQNAEAVKLLLSLAHENPIGIFDQFFDHIVIGLILSKSPDAIEKVLDLFGHEGHWFSHVHNINPNAPLINEDEPDVPSGYTLWSAPYYLSIMAEYGSDNLSLVERATNHGNPLIRLAAIYALQDVSSPSVTKRLEQMLVDEDSRVRLGAAVILRHQTWTPSSEENTGLLYVAAQDWKSCVEHGKPVVARLRTILTDKDPLVQSAAIRTVAKILGYDAKTDIINLLNDHDSHARTGAVIALKIIGDNDSLCECLHDPDPYIRAEAARSLAYLGKPMGVEKIVASLVSETDEASLSSIAYALKRLGWQPSTEQERVAFYVGLHAWDKCSSFGVGELPYLLHWFRLAPKHYSSIRVFATPLAHSLIECGGDRITGVFLDLVNDHRRSFDEAYDLGLECLSQYRTADIMEILERERAYLLEILAEDQGNRRKIIEALGIIGGKEMASLLLAYLSDPFVAGATASALIRINNQEIVPDLAKLLPVSQASSQTILNVIEKIGGVDGLLMTLADNVPGMGWKIANRLVNIKTDITESLVKGLCSDNPSMRGFIAYVMGERKTMGVGDKLLLLLEDTNSFVRYSAAEALGKLCYVPSIPGLKALLTDNQLVFRDGYARVYDAASAALELITSQETVVEKE